MLDVRGATKRFGGLVAVSEVDLHVDQGEIVSLIGPNGAGKTTLFAMIAGFLKSDGGEVKLNGTSILGMKPHMICQMGMVRTFQITQPFAGLTTRQNIMVGAYSKTSSQPDAERKAEEVAEIVGMTALLDRNADNLTVAGRKRLELARALATGPSLLLLDEVMAGLNPTEIDEIVAVIKGIRDTGVTIFLIEHVMKAVMNLSDRTYVLNDGKLIAAGTPASVAADPQVIEAYLGHGAAETMAGSSLMISIRNLDAGYGSVSVLRDVSMEIGEGEIVAVLGSNGVGKTTLNNTLSGLIRPSAGEVTFEGSVISGLPPADIVARGLIHVPEGRKLFPNLSVRDNLELGSYKRGRANRSQNLDKVLEVFPKLRERIEQLAGTLSGGEQQMVAIGRGLMSEPKVLLLDEPSLGLSPLLVEQMFALIKQINDTGLSLILVEQNVIQSLAIADRAYVIEEGSVTLSGSAAELRENSDLKKSYLGL